VFNIPEGLLEIANLYPDMFNTTGSFICNFLDSMGTLLISEILNSSSSGILITGLPFALKVYNDPIGERSSIREDNIGKSGVYAWYKHTLESLEKMKNRVISSETKTKMSLSAKERLKREGIMGPFAGKHHAESSLALLSAAARNRVIPPVPGIKVEVTDSETNITITYDSIRKAADALNSDIKTLPFFIYII
jgi:hypothetical protein